MPSQPLPTLLIPGLMATPDLYADQTAALWRLGPVTVADHRRDATMDGIAQSILAAAPSRFQLIGLSMGGYIALSIMQLAKEKVAALALLDTSARPDSEEQTKGRLEQIGMAHAQGMGPLADLLYPRLVAKARHEDARLSSIVRQMAEDTGADAFERQQRAIMGRADSRPLLPSIGCPVLVLVGDQDQVTPLPVAQEMADAIPDATLEVIPESGHLSTLEQPQRVTQALLRFFDR